MRHATSLFLFVAMCPLLPARGQSPPGSEQNTENAAVKYLRADASLSHCRTSRTAAFSRRQHSRSAGWRVWGDGCGPATCRL